MRLGGMVTGIRNDVNKCHRMKQQAEICGNEIESYRGEIHKTSLVELANKVRRINYEWEDTANQTRFLSTSWDSTRESREFACLERR